MRHLKTVSFALLLILVTYSATFAASSSAADHKLASLERKTDTCTFAVVGDNRSGDEIYRKVVGMIMARKPDFVVNVGDLIPRPGSAIDWKRFWELSAPVTVPYFQTVGNHDVSNRKSEEIYKEQVDLPGNELYYSFSCGDSLFVVLDTSIIGQSRRISGEQSDWLKNLLESANKRHKFVFLHHPMYSGEILFEWGLDSHPEERDRLRDLLVKNKVDAVFAGHLHLYRRKTINGITQIITGGAGAPLIATEENGGFFHFILMTVKGDTASGEVIDLNGDVRDRFTFKQP